MPIRQLPQSLVNRIAAGEVIERPASVVKELVENSIDAGATRVSVDVEEGGLSLLRITDDGGGIAPEELPLALAAHATSKLTSDADLEAIATFGFRGEALASISSVSQMRLVSRQHGAEAGAAIESKGETTSGVTAAASNTGTTIEVRNLFFNVPARRKFMKTPGTEFSHIADTVLRLALPHPGVHFSLTHNGRQSAVYEPVGDLRSRLLAAWPEDYRKRYLPIDLHENGLSVTGIVGLPELALPAAKHQYLYVNGRSIRDRFIQHALREAFRGLTEPGRHPPAVLLISLAPGEVDVNVHPTKAEVRFRDSSRIYGLVHSVVREALLGADLTPRAQARSVFGGVGSTGGGGIGGGGVSGVLGGGPDARAAAPEQRQLELSQQVAHEPRLPLQARLAEFFKNAPIPAGPAAPGQAMPGQAMQGPAMPGQATQGPAAPVGAAGMQAEAPIAEAGPTPSMPAHIGQAWGRESAAVGHAGALADGTAGMQERAIVSPRPDDAQRVGGGTVAEGGGGADDRAAGSVGSAAGDGRAGALGLPAASAIQLHNTYLVVESQEGLLIIDQHALHERILFEELLTRVSRGPLETQRLLIPLTFPATPRQMALAEELAAVLAPVGIELTSFGPGTLAVHSFPSLLSRLDPVSFARDLLSKAENDPTPPTREELLHSVLDMMSCKAAVKAGDPLTQEEIAALLQQRHLISRSSNCPHGRPTTLALSLRDLEKQFKRTGF